MTAARTRRRARGANAPATPQELTAQLDAFVADLGDEEDAMADVLRAAARWVPRFSERNALLIVMQAPDATDLESYVGWQARGRQVRSGESGVRIVAQAGRSGGSEEQRDESGEVTEAGRPGRQRFKAVSRFDISQTGPITVTPKDGS